MWGLGLRCILLEKICISPVKYLGDYQLDATLNSNSALFWWLQWLPGRIEVRHFEDGYFLSPAPLRVNEGWGKQLSLLILYEMWDFFILIPLLAFYLCLWSIFLLCSHPRLCFLSALCNHWNPGSRSQGIGKHLRINFCTSVELHFRIICGLCRYSFMFMVNSSGIHEN